MTLDKDKYYGFYRNTAGATAVSPVLSTETELTGAGPGNGVVRTTEILDVNPRKVIV